MTKTKSACGAAKLVAAVFGVDQDGLKQRLGLPTSGDEKEYRDYQKLLKSGRSPLWGKKLALACFQCGTQFERSALEVIHYINSAGYQRYFCNRRCQGVYAGTHYGFKTHPENTGPPFKWNRRAIWRLYLLTGYRQRVLSELLGIPQSTVGKYITELRKKGVR